MLDFDEVTPCLGADPAATTFTEEEKNKEARMQFSVENMSLSLSSMGTRRNISVYRFGTGRPGPKIYLQAGLHADERPGW
ncbi:hypothetical protein GOL96_28120 [Sinorhizobium medicae]|nr:hypothetical protein [Sinorhizobium medicae]MDX1237646.1 hypothetical protein [Sinorhizobium medicae]